MLNHVDNIRRFYLIDPYINYSTYEKNYNENGVTIADYEKVAHANLDIFKHKTVFIKKKFQDATDDVPSLDFCYYDVDKDFEKTFAFIKLYWGPKIKPGGIIGGWNYDAGHKGVVDAVNEFTEENNLKLNGEKQDWWVIKK